MARTWLPGYIGNNHRLDFLPGYIVARAALSVYSYSGPAFELVPPSEVATPPVAETPSPWAIASLIRASPSTLSQNPRWLLGLVLAPRRLAQHQCPPHQIRHRR
jgi:hypothetical protein